MASPMNQKRIAEYFDLLSDKAVCKLCSCVLKRDGLFNLKTHILRVHQINNGDFKGAKNPGFSASSAVKMYKNKMMNMNISEGNLLRSCIGLVTEDSIPLSILSSQNFKNIIDPICRGLSVQYGKDVSIDSNVFEETLKKAAENIRYAIKIELSDRVLSLKFEIMTRLVRNVFAVSAQFIKNDNIESHILGMFEIQRGATSPLSDLAMKISNLLAKYDISPDRVISFTSDHVGLCSIFESREDGCDEDDRNESYCKNLHLFKTLFKLPVDDMEITCYMAYIAQLCLLEVIKDTAGNVFLFSCRNLVKFFRDPSNGFWKIFELRCLPMPQLDCPLKWGSTFGMISAINNAKPIIPKIDYIEDKYSDEKYEINDAFWEYVEAYCVVFDRLQHTILKFQQEQLHYGNFYAEWLKCKICTEKLIEKDERIYVQIIGKRLLNSIESKTAQLLDNESLVSCLYLDPRFTHTLTTAQKHVAVSYLTKLYAKIRRTMIDAPNNPASTAASDSSEFTTKEDEYLNDYLKQELDNTGNKSPKTVDVCTKLENLQLPFLRVDADVLHFWRGRKQLDFELHALSSICFAIPATHVQDDRVFSSLKVTLDNNRNLINMDTLENILLVKLNPKYLDEGIDNLLLSSKDKGNTLGGEQTKS